MYFLSKVDESPGPKIAVINKNDQGSKNESKKSVPNIKDSTPKLPPKPSGGQNLNYKLPPRPGGPHH